MDLRVDADRGSVNRDLHGYTGIYIRAKGLDDKWGSYDIAELNRSSLLAWVKGKDRLWLENLVLVMLGHDQRAGVSAEVTNQLNERKDR